MSQCHEDLLVLTYRRMDMFTLDASLSWTSISRLGRHVSQDALRGRQRGFSSSASGVDAQIYSMQSCTLSTVNFHEQDNGTRTLPIDLGCPVQESLSRKVGDFADVVQGM